MAPTAQARMSRTFTRAPEPTLSAWSVTDPSNAFNNTSILEFISGPDIGGGSGGGGGGGGGTGSTIIGEGVDTDGDGFSDSFENAFGSNPNSTTSTPTGQAGTSATIQPLTLTRTLVALNFAKDFRDSITLTGTLPVPAGFTVSGAKVDLDFGGVTKVFVLDSKGSAVVGSDSLKIPIKLKKGVVSAQTAKYTVTLKNGSFKAALAAVGLTNTTVSKAQKPVSVAMIFNSTAFQVSKTLAYTARTGKTGTGTATK